MSVLKKIIGVFLLIIAGIISLGTFLNLINEIILFINKSEYSSYDVGYTIGLFLGLAIISVIVYFIAKLGLKWINTKKVETDSLDEIGNSV